MNKLKLACIASLLSVGVAQASTSCNGFEIKIHNQLADDLLVTSIVLNGAEIQPHGIQKISGNSTQVFTVNNSADNVPMQGHFNFHTMSLPSKSVKVEYQLENKGLVCEHTDMPADNNDYHVEKTRLSSHVSYTISNK